MFESLKNLGEAFKNYKLSQDTEKEEETTLEKYLDFQKAKEEYKPTEEQKAISSIEDYPGQTKTGEQILIEEAKQEKKEDELDKKITDIQKVLKTFSEDTQAEVFKPAPLDTSGTSADSLNVKPLDLSAIRQKEYLTSLIQQPSSQTDRVSLLYNELKKQGLI